MAADPALSFGPFRVDTQNECVRRLADDAKTPLYIETAHRRGFRFIATLTPAPPVVSRQFSVVSQTEAKREKAKIETEKEKPPPPDAELPSQSSVLSPQHLNAPLPSLQSPVPTRFWSNKGLMLTGVLLLAGVIVVVQYLSLPLPSTQHLTPSPQPALPLPDKPSIIVLPFTNLSGDPGQEYFSDGLTEILTTDLSQLPSLFVIARHSAFTYKGKAATVQEVSREMGVRYVLEGSVLKADDKVRITAQLIDAVTGYHLWSERYDRPLTDIFALHDESSCRKS